MRAATAEAEGATATFLTTGVLITTLLARMIPTEAGAAATTGVAGAGVERADLILVGDTTGVVGAGAATGVAAREALRVEAGVLATSLVVDDAAATAGDRAGTRCADERGLSSIITRRTFSAGVLVGTRCARRVGVPAMTR